MSDFTDFPGDDRLWFIRHIDGYIQPHKGTESTSVRCYLGPLPWDWRDASALNEDQIAFLFGDENPECFITTIFACALASYAVGFVFHRRNYVGSLPAQQLNLRHALARAEESALKIGNSATGRRLDLVANSLLGRSTNNFPYKALPTRQLKLDSDTRSKTQVLVARDQDGEDEAEHVQFIIPRTVIFRTFFAFTSELAEILTSGAWSTLKDQAIFMGEFAGNRTGVNAETGNWDIILQLGMSLDDAPMMALLHFDSYAERAANRLHEPMRLAVQNAERKGEDDAHWFSNAEIPFDPERGPYTGVVSGYYLSSRRDQFFRGRTFLVTAIHSMNMPRGMPTVARTLVNDSTDGAVRILCGDRRAFDGIQRGREKRPSDMPSVDTHQGSTKKQAFDLPSLSFAIDPPPVVTRLRKNKSVKYTSPVIPPREESSAEGSSGSRDGHQDSKSHLHSAQVVRETSEVFVALISALESLKAKNKIRSYSLAQPTDHYQRVAVGAYQCWNFLDSGQRNHLKSGRKRDWSTRRWAYLPATGASSRPVERAALVLSIELPDGTRGLWFEIQQSSQDLSSAFVIARGGSQATEITTALGIIRTARGSSMDKHFAAKGIRAFCHPHYREKDSSNWREGPLEAFFEDKVLNGLLAD